MRSWGLGAQVFSLGDQWGRSKNQVGGGRLESRFKEMLWDVGMLHQQCS